LVLVFFKEKGNFRAKRTRTGELVGKRLNIWGEEQLRMFLE